MDRGQLLIEVSDILKDLGVTANLRGYYYLREAIVITVEDNAVTLITKRIYPEVASRFNTKASNVERCIRQAIVKSWKRLSDKKCNEKEAYQIFGETIGEKKPCNYDYIRTVNDYYLSRQKSLSTD